MMKLSIAAFAAAGLAFFGCAEQPMFNVGFVSASAPSQPPQSLAAVSSGAAAPSGSMSAGLMNVPPPPANAPPPPDADAPPPGPPADEPSAAPNGRLGIGLGVVNGGVAVKIVVPGSSAAEAGVALGDMVTAIDGASTSAMPFMRIIGRLRGPAGTAVTMTLVRDGGDPFDLRLVRRAPAAPAPAPVAVAASAPVGEPPAEAAPSEDESAPTISDAEAARRLLP